jgi:hypothetical protein
MALEHIYRMRPDGSEGNLVARIDPLDVDYLITIQAARDDNWVIIANPSFAAPDFTLEEWKDATPFDNRYYRNERG